MRLRAEKETVIIWQIRVAAAALILCALISPFIRFTGWMYLPILILLGLAAFFIFWYIPQYFRWFEVDIDTAGITVYSGIIFKTVKIMPFPRFIYVRSFKTPISAVFGLEGLALRAARGILIIPELTNENIQKILKKVGENNEEEL